MLMGIIQQVERSIGYFFQETRNTSEG